MDGVQLGTSSLPNGVLEFYSSNPNGSSLFLVDSVNVGGSVTSATTTETYSSFGEVTTDVIYDSGTSSATTGDETYDVEDPSDYTITINAAVPQVTATWRPSTLVSGSASWSPSSDSTEIEEDGQLYFDAGWELYPMGPGANELQSGSQSTGTNPTGPVGPSGSNYGPTWGGTDQFVDDCQGTATNYTGPCVVWYAMPGTLVDVTVDVTSSTNAPMPQFVIVQGVTGVLVDLTPGVTYPIVIPEGASASALSACFVDAYGTEYSSTSSLPGMC